MSPALRAAQRNLIELPNVAARRRARADALAAKLELDRRVRAREREIAAQERSARNVLRQEYLELADLCDSLDVKLQAGTLTDEERGAYEEVDHRRWELAEELGYFGS
jgi:F0F1-type ATP synthase membrane subunit b/b'